MTCGRYKNGMKDMTASHSFESYLKGGSINSWDNMIFLVLFITTVALRTTQPLVIKHLEDASYWNEVGLAELNAALGKKINNGVAKNVIVFIGDGMGVSTVTASRIYQGQTEDGLGESSRFSFESFPFTGLSKTYSVNKQTADSASTATAMFTGSKTNQGVLGLDMQAPINSCHVELNKKAELESFMTWGQAENKATGIVTTTSVTDATPAATYSHVNVRDWECDSQIPANLKHCIKDIAQQLIEDEPGKNFKVVMGGGRVTLGNMTEELTEGTCRRSDGRNLVNEWIEHKEKATYVTTADELQAIDPHETEHLMGLFAPGHLSFLGEGEKTRPPVELMVTKAIQILSKNENGFFLMVECGRIDQAHHKSYAKLSMIETMECSRAVATAVDLIDLEETLIIVTADHSHPLTLSGYADRGNDILGFSDESDESFQQTLTYANGPGAQYHHIEPDMTDCSSTNCSDLERNSTRYIKDIRNDPNKSDVHYQQSTSVFLAYDTHGGEDVAIYANGPRSHLIEGVHEQHYIGHAISCAACVGPHALKCCYPVAKNNSQWTKSSLWLLLVLKFFV